MTKLSTARRKRPYNPGLKNEDYGNWYDLVQKHWLSTCSPFTLNHCTDLTKQIRPTDPWVIKYSLWSVFRPNCDAELFLRITASGFQVEVHNSSRRTLFSKITRNFRLKNIARHAWFTFSSFCFRNASNCAISSANIASLFLKACKKLRLSLVMIQELVQNASFSSEVSVTHLFTEGHKTVIHLKNSHN